MSEEIWALDPERLATLQNAASRRGLASLLHRLEATARPAIAVSVGSLIDDPRVGGSRLGGLPDLASEWPMHDGRRMRFIGQVDLADLPGPIASFVPAAGLLSFFIGPDEPAADVVHRVVYTTSRDLRRLDSAGVPTWADDDDPGTAPLMFKPAVSLPPADRLIDREDQWDDVHALVRELLPSETRLFGWPEQIGSDPALDAYLCRTGHADILYNHHKTAAEHERAIADAWGDGDSDRAERLEAQRASLAWFRDDRQRHDAEVTQWQVLLQIGSLRQLDMTWWDSGLLSFLVDTRDLARLDFTRTYAAIQST